MNIICIHCSCLILIADFKLKMSRSYRSYDEDWQRRKSLLIRSLFHDIPILSPVQEESHESSDYIQPRDIFDVPSRTYDAPSRPYSPLPPLIIERAPNKHDEPEEYYRSLLTKIKKIYRKLFIENFELDSDDFNSTLNDNSIHNDYFIQSDASDDVNLDVNDNRRQDNIDFDSINDGVNKSYDSFNSNGYRADFESIESDELIDVVNCTKSNDDEEMRYEEERSDTITTSDQEMSETDHFSEFNIDHESKATKESNCEEIEKEDLEKNSDHETNETDELNTIRTHQSELRKIEEHLDNKKKYNQETSKSDDLEIIELEKSVNNQSEESNNSTKTYELETSESTKSNNFRLADYELNVDNKPRNLGIRDKVGNVSEESDDIVNNDKNANLNKKESISSSKEENVSAQSDEEMMDEIQTNASEFSEGTDYRQITTKALIHVDGSKDILDRESQVYEDSVRSLILPTREFRRLFEARVVNVEDKIEELSALEENEDPATITFGTDDSEISNHIELMRTPQPKVSQESIPITRCSESDNTSEHTALPPKLTTMTSSTQDGGANNFSELETTDDIHGILTSIFNDSPNIGGGCSSRRKRKLYEDISVQTSERVSWEEMRGNFFVGAPKIFRLCACADHVCD